MIEVKFFEIEKIKPYPKNAKKHPKNQIEKIADSIKNFGFNQPIVVDGDGVIIVGHGRFEAAKLLDFKKVPVIKVTDLSEDKVKAYRLADNKLNESDWDMELVMAEFFNFDESLRKLSGFNNDDFDVNQDDLETEKQIKSVFEIVVECDSEEDQRNKFNELSKKFKCRILTL